jgi:hypothetical protein
LEAALSLWDQNSKLGWSALHLALSLCVLAPSTKPRSPADETHSQERIRLAFEEVTRINEEAKGWSELPLPPPAWIKAESMGRRHGMWDEVEDSMDPRDLVDSNESWIPSPTHWYDRYAAQVIKRIPLTAILSSRAAPVLLDFLSGLLVWTISKLSPPWIRVGRRNHGEAQLFEWTHSLGRILGKVAGLCSFNEVEARFLNPIFALEDDHCWKVLSPFVDLYICMYVYDAKEVPLDSSELLMRSLDRFLKAPTFNPDTYHSGELYGFDLPSLAKALMFVAIDEPALGSARYANGDYSEVHRILPVVDRFVRTAGWVSTIMSHFLTLCERAKETYPAEQFADQILDIVKDGRPALKGWNGTFLPARIAGLVQGFADREAPMPLDLGQKLLRILDLLVDMGDRRSAALQLGESFREIQTERGHP